VRVPLEAALCALWARDLVHAVLPRYDACVSPLRVLAFGATGLALSTFASIVLMTVGRRVILVPAAVFLSALSGGLQLLSLRWNGGLTGIAAAATTAYLLSGSVLLSLAAAGVGYAFAGGMALIARCLAPTGIAVLLTWGLSRGLLHEPLPLTLERLGVLLGASLALVAGYLLLVWPFARGIGFRALVTESGLPILGPLVKAITRDRGDGSS